jgi:hypothetical protein
MSGQDSDSDGDSRNYTEAVSTRLSKQVKRRYDTYREDRELGNAQALRRLVRAGLDAEQEPDGDARAATVALVGGAVYAAVAGFTGPSLPTLTVGGLFVALTVAWTNFPFLRGLL